MALKARLNGGNGNGLFRCLSAVAVTSLALAWRRGSLQQRFCGPVTVSMLAFFGEIFLVVKMGVDGAQGRYRPQGGKTSAFFSALVIANEDGAALLLVQLCGTPKKG